MLSAAAHHVMAAGMVMGSDAATQSHVTDMADHMTVADHMAGHDAGAPCPMSSDCSNDADMRAMACSVHCATVLGVLVEPGRVAVTSVTHPLDWPLVRPLASLHGPPDSPPPKRPILI